MRVEWTEAASNDLDRLHAYIAADSPHYAMQFVARILGAVDRLENFPQIGRPVPEAERRDIRELLFRNYRIIYLIEPDRIRILSVIHGSRDLNRFEPVPWNQS